MVVKGLRQNLKYPIFYEANRCKLSIVTDCDSHAFL